MIGRRSYFVLAVIVSWAFLTPDGLAAQNCNYCHPCAGGIYTSPGAIPWPVLYVDQSSCMAYEEGCEGLIPCGGGTEEDAEDVLAAIDSGDWSELGRLAKGQPRRSGVPSRAGCGPRPLMRPRDRSQTGGQRRGGKLLGAGAVTLRRVG